MLLCTVRDRNTLLPALEFDGQIIDFQQIRKSIGIRLPSAMEGFVSDSDYIEIIRSHYRELSVLAKKSGTPAEEVSFAPPISFPPKIWCIGLNFQDHASDLGARIPTEPASFMRPANTMIGNGDPILLPADIGRVTAEAELGIVIGRTVKNVDTSGAMDAILGFVSIIDVTALDILEKNPRFLTRAKSYDTFFSVGPAIYVPESIPSLGDIEVSTVLNGKRSKTNSIRNMIFNPAFLVSFHSRVFTLQPGDIISTGTPGAVIIEPGDTVKCEIDGLPVPAVQNPVIADGMSQHR